MDERFNINRLLYDKTFRANLRNDPKKYAVELGYTSIKENQQFKVTTNTENTFYVMLPNVDIRNVYNDQLEELQAAGSASSAGTGGTASTILCVATCWSSIATASSAGTGGTKG